MYAQKCRKLVNPISYESEFTIWPVIQVIEFNLNSVYGEANRWRLLWVYDSKPKNSVFGPKIWRPEILTDRQMKIIDNVGRPPRRGA